MSHKAFIRPLQIEQVLNGFVVKVGCQTVVFNTIDALCDTLKAYCLDPQKVEKEYGWEENGPENCPPPTPGIIYPSPFSLGTITTAGSYNGGEASANQYVPREQAPARDPRAEVELPSPYDASVRNPRNQF